MTWNTDTQTKEALDFCKWWLSKDAQIAFAQAGDDGEEVVALAENAMYSAKSLGKNRHEIATELRSAPLR